MTKTLTEQWYDDTIDRSHHYYVRIKGKEEMGCGGIDFIDIIRPPLFRDQVDKLLQYNDPEVLAPVPSYDKVKEIVQKIHILNEQNTKQYNELCEEIKKNNTLEKQLDIATKALKEYADPKIWEMDGFCYKDGDIARKALKEMECVK